MAGEQIIYDVPIFPLNTVLFPGMPLPLHIFEERYRIMVDDLRRGDNRFCVSLIDEGQEVGGYAEPYRVACLAEVVHLQDLRDGRFLLVAVGVERVRILTLDRLVKPYLTGSIELWPDEPEAVDPRLMQKATRLYLQYSHYVMKLAGQEEDKMTAPTEPDILSYLMAATLQVDAPVHQDLLEIPGCGKRLQTEADMMQTELPFLRALAEHNQPPSAGYGQFSAN